ncbi:hypothetical protein ACJX0J_010509, partial [Zea mays]
GNAIYAEVPAKLLEQKGSLLQLNKSQYKVIDAPLMTYFTVYSIIEVCRDPPSTFPLYVYNLIPYEAIDANGPKSKDFHGSVYLSGGAACHWYFNPSINEARPYYQRIHNENITIKLPPLTNEPTMFVNPPETQHKDLKELLDSFFGIGEGFKCIVTIIRLLDDQPWWYKACNTCPNKPSMR